MSFINRFCLLFIAASLVVLTAETSFAKACITGMRPGGSTSLELPNFAEFNVGEEAYIYQASLTCQDLQAVKMGLRAFSFTYNLTRLALACGPVGVPVAVGIFGTGAVLMTAELVVNNIPCEDESKEQSEHVMKIEICEALRAQGIDCDPKKMVRN